MENPFLEHVPKTWKRHISPKRALMVAGLLAIIALGGCGGCALVKSTLWPTPPPTVESAHPLDPRYDPFPGQEIKVRIGPNGALECIPHSPHN